MWNKNNNYDIKFKINLFYILFKVLTNFELFSSFILK